MGLVNRVVTKGPKTWCFLRKLYLAWRAVSHLGQLGLDLAYSSVKGSDSGVVISCTSVMAYSCSARMQESGSELYSHHDV